MQTKLVISVDVVENFVVGGVDVFHRSDEVWQHVEAGLDVHLGHHAAVCHPASNKEVLDEVVGQLQNQIETVRYLSTKYLQTKPSVV